MRFFGLLLFVWSAAFFAAPVGPDDANAAFIAAQLAIFPIIVVRAIFLMVV
jgi:hypothetical protein